MRGITVRSRSVVGNLGAALQTIVGGNISIYAELCEKAREEAFELMLRHAAAMGANAVVAMRYDANEGPGRHRGVGLRHGRAGRSVNVR